MVQPTAHILLIKAINDDLFKLNPRGEQGEDVKIRTVLLHCSTAEPGCICKFYTSFESVLLDRHFRNLGDCYKYHKIAYATGRGVMLMCG